jgi:hypothetical protein
MGKPCDSVTDPIVTRRSALGKLQGDSREHPLLGRLSLASRPSFASSEEGTYEPLCGMFASSWRRLPRAVKCKLRLEAEHDSKASL